MEMAVFVIVHGAWAGAWAWVRVADRLRARGHRVHVPTLSGVGERAHLGALDIRLATHVDDVCNEITFNELAGVVLVAHSYGGIVGTGVVEKLEERIASVVFVDALVPADGQGFSDFIPGGELAGQLTAAPPTSPGDYFSEEDRAWVDRHGTPQPTATLTDKLRVTGAYQRVKRKTYVVATGWDGFQGIAAGFREQVGWNIGELPCGHDMSIDMPDELTALLIEAVG
jgi:pimeloyl-ACP methyl ester carboxylesterase